MQRKAIIYTRVSTGKQADTGTSLEGQELACLRKAAEIKAQVVTIISDPGVSGGLFLTRPGIQQALRAIQQREADTLIVFKLDRAGRDVDALRDIRRIVEQAGGTLVFADGMSFENNATGRLMFTQLAGFAEFEKEVIRERTIGGSRRCAEKGIQPQRNSPFGYHIVTKTDVIKGDHPASAVGTYLIVEEQAEWVRRIFETYAAGSSMRDVIRMLIQNKVPTQRGNRIWYRCSVQSILDNPVHVGRPTYGRSTSRVEEVQMTNGEAKRVTRILPTTDETRIITLAAPPLIDEQTWRLVQMRRAENRTKLSGNPERRYLLTGLIKCPVCKRNMTGRGNNDPQRRYYLCRQANTYSEPGVVGCVRKQYHIDRSEQTILNSLLQLCREPQWFESAVEAYNLTDKRLEATKDVGGLHDRLAVLDKKERATAQAQVQALVEGRSTDVYDRLLSEVDHERKTINEQLAESNRHVEAAPAVLAKTLQEKHQAVMEAVEEVLTAADVLTVGERNRILTGIIRKITPVEESLAGGDQVFEIQTVYDTSP